MKQTISEHLLSISKGYIYLQQPLNIDEDYTAIIKGSITKTTDQSNQDGSIKRIYTLKGAEVNIFNKDGEEVQE